MYKGVCVGCVCGGGVCVGGGGARFADFLTFLKYPMKLNNFVFIGYLKRQDFAIFYATL